MTRRQFLRNVSYTLSSNGFSFLASALVVMVLPKLIGVEEYGYFQFYVLLSNYALYFHFGWCDGIYLRYVGTDEADLPAPVIRTQFWMSAAFAALLTLVLVIGVLAAPLDGPKTTIFLCSAGAVLLAVPKTMASVVQQAMSHMREYARIVLAEKLFLLVLLSLLLAARVTDFRLLVLADLAGKLAALLYGAWACRGILRSAGPAPHPWREAFANIKVGIFLLISNLSSMLITGVVQFSIEHRWGIETFGRVSLTFNVSRLLLVAITATSMVMVPALKKTAEEDYPKLYRRIRFWLLAALGALLLGYYPLKAALTAWLPQYRDGLQYMALLFPMCLFESKTTLLVNSFLKALRKERWLCGVNVVTMLLGCGLSALCVHLLGNLYLAVLCIPVLLAVRGLLLELLVGRLFGEDMLAQNLLECGLAAVFIASGWLLDSVWCLAVYGAAYLVYLALSLRVSRGKRDPEPSQETSS